MRGTTVPVPGNGHDGVREQVGCQVGWAEEVPLRSWRLEQGKVYRARGNAQHLPAMSHKEEVLTPLIASRRTPLA